MSEAKLATAMHEAQPTADATTAHYSVMLGVQKSMEHQEKLLKKQLFHTRLRTVLMTLLCLSVVGAAFFAIDALRNLSQMAKDTSGVVYSLEQTVNDLQLQETVAGIDAMVLEGTALIEDGTAVVQSGSAQIDGAMVQVNESLDGIQSLITNFSTTLDAFAKIDFEALNTSIERLDEITRIMGKLFGIKQS